MKRLSKIFNFYFIIILFGINTLETKSNHETNFETHDTFGENPYVIPTYECAGIYWDIKENDRCQIRYKGVWEDDWKNGLDLVYDTRDGEYRGSIIGLKPNSKYLVELTTPDSKAQLDFTTRNDKFPIGKITILEEGELDKPILINESGTPDAYHLVTVHEGAKTVLNLKNASPYGIEIDADYVIVRGIEIRNAAVHGILIRENRHDVVIEQCHITFWGRIGGPRTFGNHEGDMDSGIFGEENCSNITIQRNLIENPRGASNNWETGHPSGPQGITFMQTKGGHVIRFNEILSTEDHGFNDGIGGGRNFSWEGNMNRDTDIYGNIIRSVWDDAIECEGANMNVRIWGNYLHFYFNGIATASTSKGPLYIFRNVLGESRKSFSNYQGGALFKTGERNEFGGGRRYIFHNTAIQPQGAYGVFTSHENPNCITRNNIFDVPGQLATEKDKLPVSDYDYDFFSGSSKGTAIEPNGVGIHTPALGSMFVPSYYLEFYPNSSIISRISGKHPIVFGDITITITDPVLQISNPLIDNAVVLPGFNDDYKGTAPDIGAFEMGGPPLRFGRRAYLSFDEGWAPWEKY